MSAAVRKPKRATTQLSAEDALRIVFPDAQSAYGDLALFQITIALQKDGWHVDYEINIPDMQGGGPHYIIDPTTGEILHKRYEQ